MTDRGVVQRAHAKWLVLRAERRAYEREQWRLWLGQHVPRWLVVAVGGLL